MACTLCAFISLVWLREQIVTNGGPDWLEPNNEPLPQLPGVGGALFGAGQPVSCMTNSYRNLNYLIGSAK